MKLLAKGWRGRGLSVLICKVGTVIPSGPGAAEGTPALMGVLSAV